MAIGFARFAFVKRSEGKNACHKSSYNSRSLIRFNGTKFQEPCTYSFINCKDGVAYSNVFLPEHVDEQFKDKEILWNAVEQVESRKNSQVCWEMVFALPDDECVSLEDRIELCTRFVNECFVRYGSAVQVDIHYPNEGKNWHAHFIGTLRPFDETGTEFSKNKIRDGFIPDVRNGKVMFPESWVTYAVDLQNSFFKERGYDITVDPSGVVAQKHIGPVRFRGKCQSLIEENGLREELNQEALKDPKQLLDHILKSHSIFDFHTVEYYVQKIEGITKNEHEQLVQEFWKQQSIVPLFSEETGGFSGKYTVHAIVEEEKKILRNGERIKNHFTHRFSYDEKAEEFSKYLHSEQKEAFKQTIEGDGLVCINGLAGTGKSTLLEALKNFYEEGGYTVRGLGPDTATCAVLYEKGFENSENIHRFLFNHKYGHRSIESDGEVWIVDESSKIGNSSLNELLRAAVLNKVKVIFTGDLSQLSPVERGTAFIKFCEKFGYVSLKNVQRQEKDQDREVVKLLSGLHGDGSRFSNTQKAIDMIESQKGFYWDESKVDSIKSLVRLWAIEKVLHPNASLLILAHKREEVQVLNDVIRLYRKHGGELGEKDYLCQTTTSTFVLSEGDHILFKRRSDLLGVENGDRGIVKEITSGTLKVELLRKGKSETVEFSPKEYSNFQLGYVSTNFASQGATYDRVFVMSSPQMRLDSYYVACSRHRQAFKVFVSKDEIANFSTLKTLATRTTTPATTIGLLTEEALSSKQKIDEYKNSNSILKRTYGKAKESVSKWDIWTRFSDLTQDKKFYKPNMDADRGFVLRIMDDQSEHPTRVITNNAFVKTDNEVELKGINASYSQKILSSNEIVINSQKEMAFSDSVIQEISGRGVIDRDLENGSTVIGDKFVQEICKEVEALKAFSQEALISINLSSEKATLFSQYLVSLEECEKIREGNPKFFSSKEWKSAIIHRNKAAHALLSTLDKREIHSVLTSKFSKELRSYSQKQEDFQSKFLKVNKASVLHAKAVKESEEKGVNKLQTSVTSSSFSATAERNMAAKQVIEKQSPEEPGISLSDVHVGDAHVFSSKCKSDPFTPLQELTGTKKRLVDDYQKKSIIVSSLYKKGLEEANERNISFKNTSVAKDFFQASFTRDESAHTLNRTLSKGDLQKIFDENQIKLLKSYACKYEERRESQEKNTLQAIENQLKSSMELLCYHLFPDGYTDRTATSFRYGNNGSLSVNVSGRYVGSFKNFESEERGGPLELIRVVKGCNFSESIKYAKDFLATRDQISVPKSHKIQRVSKESNWISMVPPKNVPPPSLEVLHPSQAKLFDEVARYRYCDEKGNLLFCILRLEPKGGGKKQIRPLSYGFDQESPSKKRWATVGYQSVSKAVYGLEKLYANPTAPVLIVEGEKAADSAGRLLEKEGVVVISWLGGTGSVEKVNWSHLKGRDVIIWPDNDKAGVKAANSIISDLRQQGVSSLKLVDPDMLEKRLPQKWDLADLLPKDMKQSFIKDALKNAKEQSVPLNLVVSGLNKPEGKENLAVFKGFVGDILCRVENRTRGELEKKHGNKTWEIKNEIVNEVTRIIEPKAEVSKLLQASGIHGAINDRLTSQILYFKALKGIDPTPSEIDRMKKAIKEVGYTVSKSERIGTCKNPNIKNHLFDRAFMQSRESCHIELSTIHLKTAIQDHAKTQSKIISQQIQKEVISAHQTEIQRRQIEK